MKSLFSLSGLLLLGSCGNAPSAQKVSESEHIAAIEVRREGGDMGYASWMRITRDSAWYWSNTVMTPENDDSFSRANTPEAWHELAGELNLEGFRAAMEGESVQPVDGVDTEIAILTNKDTITKRNAYENPEWNHVLRHTQILVDKQHVIR